MIFFRESLPEALKNLAVFIFALLSLILLMPVILMLAIIIKITSKGPVLYTQKRVGKNGKEFKLLKFRSLIFEEGSYDGFPLLSGREDSRMTPIGRFMRKHKLDEIPNFFNVLKGEMALIGPRPEQKYFIDKIGTRNPDFNRLFTIKPGITSWGQVRYGYASTVEQMAERLEYDLYYLKNRNLQFDFKIALLTIGIILKGEGI